MGIFKLKSDFQSTPAQQEVILKLAHGIKKGYRFQTLLGVTGSGKTFTMANVIALFDKPILVIAPNKTLAAQLFHEYKNFFPENSVNYFVSYYDYYQPEAYLHITDTYIEKEAMINEEIDKLRHKATSALLTRKDVIIVASVSCIYNLGLPTNYLTNAIYLETGKPITRGDLIRQLVKIQYTRTQGALKRGNFRVRGDVLEIIPPNSENIVWIEIKEQKINQIMTLDPLSRKIKDKKQDVLIFPVKHFISSEPQIEQAINNIKKELSERLTYFKRKKLFVEAERLERRTLYDIEMLRTIGYCYGIENYSRHLSGKLAGEPPDTLLSYFASAAGVDKNSLPNFLTIIDESHITIPQLEGMYWGDKSRKESLIEYGWRLPSALDNRPLKWEEFLERIGQTVFTSATPGRFEIENSSQIVEQVIRPTGIVDPPIEVRPVFDPSTNTNQIDNLVDELKAVVAKKERALVNTLTKRMAEDLTEFLKRQGVKCHFMHSETKTLERTKLLTDFRAGKFDILVGVNLLREGLDLPEVTLVAILDADREGFLRSETSLIQTMGRASRNVSGKVILYANEVTDSIKKAISEVERRRKIQLAYNKKYHINPQTIKKKVETLIPLD